MPPKRPARRAASLSSDSDEHEKARPGGKKIPLRSDVPALKVNVITPKLEADEISDLRDIIARHSNDSIDLEVSPKLVLEYCSDAKDADVVITGIGMPKRLGRHISWELAKMRPIVTPKWLYDSAELGEPMPTGEYIAIDALREELKKNNYPGGVGTPSPIPPKPKARIEEHTPPPAPHTLSYEARLACCRASPLVCPNQRLIAEMDIIRRFRWLERDDIAALSYSRAIAIIKAYPRRITERIIRDELPKLPWIGHKMTALIKEFTKTGNITESRRIEASERYKTLSLFTTIYGIGPITAQKLYHEGMRTLEQLEERYWYDPARGTAADQLEADDEDGEEDQPQGTINLNMTISIALKMRADFAEKIPRDEVEEIHRVVMGELGQIQGGCVGTIVGGYRRGKELSNDVDIVITHPEIRSGTNRVGGLCKKLVQRLIEKGLVVNVMHLSNFRAPDALRTTHWDSLEKALTVFTLPTSPDGPKRFHRRLDLIFAIPEVYWTAIVGWTGSTMFERDLRVRAKELGLKFNSAGIVRRQDSKFYLPKSEKEVFDLFNLEWVHPTLRNADA